jgi:hypothetical protein
LTQTSTNKSIDTLVEDIYSLFDPEKDHTVNEEHIEQFGENIKDLLRERLAGRSSESRDPLRFSALGKKDRQLWFASRNYETEELLSKTYLKFTFGDVIEQLLLFLAKESGHEVLHEQAEVEVDGVLGHIDAVIDGHVVDVKSASPFGFRKFETGTLFEDDAFGYIQQLSGYANVLTPDGPNPLFLAMDKVAGDITTLEVPEFVVKDNKPEERIAHLREIISRDTPPPKCYDDVPDGKSGNRKLVAGCSYCGYKKHCWDGLRGFAYSGTPRYLTKVVREPDVPEFKV